MDWSIVGIAAEFTLVIRAFRNHSMLGDIYGYRGKHGFQLCGKQNSLSRLRREIAILQGFYQRQPVYRLAGDLNVGIKPVTRVYQRLRFALFHIAKLEGRGVGLGQNFRTHIYVSP